MALFTEGKLFRKAGEGSGGGGGGDQHNLGWYATQAALEEAYPTATAGDWAIVGATDTVWIWDTDNNEWVDSDQKGQVTSVNGQTGAVTIATLPDQTGQSGKFLTTDGTDASWSDKPLVNSTTWSNALTILGTPANAGYGTNVGFSSKANGRGSSLGYDAQAGSEGTAIGSGTRSTGFRSVAVGEDADTNYKQYSVCIGYKSKINAINALQINLSDSAQTNSDANTVKIANANGNFELMSADGTVPTTRLTKVNSTITLTAAGWSSNTQTVNVTGMTATGVVLVSPAPASAADYASAGIICTAQGAGTLTFTCTTTPTNAITVNVVCL